MTKKSIPTKPIPVNPTLVWDYEIPPEENQTDAFRKWYLARVLTRGTSTDLRAIGFDTIYVYLPELVLPPAIRSFWEWYFSLEEVKPCFEHLDGSFHTHAANPSMKSVDGS